ncbi:MAG: OmpA family protein [Acidobacteria bacterium]|nr:OmpA family protein [Acidobacteriota bacterium]
MSQEQPIYVIKKIVKGGGHHGGAWKVAYADFVTAMMAFFMVLWLLSASEQVQKAVGGYFSDPTGNGKQVGTTESGFGGETVNLAANDMAKLKDKLQAAMQSTPQFQKIKEQVRMIIKGDGLRVELLETDLGMFFDSGSPAPTVRATEILGTLAQEIGKLPNRIVIEGHTDSRPFSSDYSNWELSADRANTARRVMQLYGVRSDQVAQIRGFADQSLRLADKPEDPSNRRISIIIQYLSRPKESGKEEPKKGDGHGADGDTHGKGASEHAKPGHGPETPAPAAADSHAKPAAGH